MGNGLVNQHFNDFILGFYKLGWKLYGIDSLVCFAFLHGQVHQSQYMTGPEIMFQIVIKFLLENTGALSGAKMVSYFTHTLF